MLRATKIRFWIGKSLARSFDVAVKHCIVPKRLPVGVHLEFDIQRFLGPVKVIVDGGANVGDTALRFARFFPKATVHAFEPIESTFKLLINHTRFKPKIFSRNLALGDKQSEMMISLDEDSELNSLLNQSAASGNNRQKVVVTTLDD